MEMALRLGLSIGVDELIYYMSGDAAIQRPSRDHYRIIGIGVDYGQQKPQHTRRPA